METVIFVKHSMKNCIFQWSGGSIFSSFRHMVSDPLEILLKVFCCFRFHIWRTFGARRGSLIDVGGNRKLMQQKGLQQFSVIISNGGSPIMISGGCPGSWCLFVPGLWRGAEGLRLAIGHALRLECGGG